jgi:hypothetical protein
MQPLFRRIAIHATLAAVILAVMGWMFAELASIWLAGQPAPPPLAGGVQVTVEMEDVGGTLRRTVPLRMAIAGVILVVVGETLLHFWRKRKPATAPTPASPPPDDAEKLLEKLLAEAEARTRAQAAQASPAVGVAQPTPVPQSRSHPKA